MVAKKKKKKTTGKKPNITVKECKPTKEYDSPLRFKHDLVCDVMYNPCAFGFRLRLGYEDCDGNGYHMVQPVTTKLVPKGSAHDTCMDLSVEDAQKIADALYARGVAPSNLINQTEELTAKISMLEEQKQDLREIIRLKSDMKTVLVRFNDAVSRLKAWRRENGSDDN